jgi:sugar transferase EpsL
MDLSISILLLILLAPLFFIISLAILFTTGFPIIFKQLRPGLHEKPFYIYKFRTMVDIKDAKGNLLSEEQRLTKLGKFLRQYSLDELPQLINVLRGDLSLVGPRPLLMEYLSLYTEEQKRRHEVKPGITGWAQINGRNAITWEEKFKFDLWYVDHHSIWIDIKILFITVKKVVLREGISAPGHISMERYKGIE